jgi:anti-sigma factor RsiW
MKCEDIREQLLDLAGPSANHTPSAEQAAHLESCAACAARLTELRQTMALLDAWQAPEASPYFDARLRARLRAEAEAPRGWFAWLHAPVFLRSAAAAALTLVLVTGIGIYQYSVSGTQNGPVVQGQTQKPVPAKAPEGSAVADLQTLDKNADLLADFDLLDDVAQPQQQVQQQ